MTSKEAARILHFYGEWRKGNDLYDVPSVAEIGLAINHAVKVLDIEPHNRGCTSCGISELFTNDYCNCCGAKQDTP